mgnify:CR=1 FL=1
MGGGVRKIRNHFFVQIKSSRCPKLDGYAIANFGVRVEHKVVKMIHYGGSSVEMEWSSGVVKWSSGVVEWSRAKVEWSSGVVELSRAKVEWASGVVEWASGLVSVLVG